MSEVAGKIATQAGAFMLEKPLGGRGSCWGASRVSRRPRCWLSVAVWWG